MRALPTDVQRALRTWEDEPAGAALLAAAAAWEDPAWRVVVVGRVSAGKSSLVNALAGEAVQEVGLGGVTRGVAEVRLSGGVVLVDTPGIDDPDRALLFLERPLRGADAVVWVVDGLQPMTRSERDVLRELALGASVHLVVCRLDIVDPADRPLVMERVVALGEPWEPVSVRALDPRREEGPPELLVPAPWPRRRVEPLRQALEGALEELDGPTLEAFERAHSRVRESFREAVRRVEGEVEKEVRRGMADLAQEAMERFGKRAYRARDTFLQALRSDGAAAAVVEVFGEPDIPLPPGRPEHAEVRRAVREVVGGRSHALRALRGAAGRWLLEGEGALMDWAEATKAHPAYSAAQRRDQLEQAARAALETL